MPFSLHTSGLCAWSDPTNLKPGEGGYQGFGSSRSRRSVFFDRSSVLWYKYPDLTFFTFTLPKQIHDDRYYSSKLSMLLENYRTRFKRNGIASKKNVRGGIKDYVYCAEVQKQRTDFQAIHFHLLTHAYIDIKEINSYWCDLIGQSSRNAVDVQHVPQNIQSIPAYMCKYFTKQTYRDTSGQIQKMRPVQCKSFNASQGLKLQPVTLDHPPGIPLYTQSFTVQDGKEKREINLRYYNTREILDTFFAEQILA